MKEKTNLNLNKKFNQIQNKIHIIALIICIFGINIIFLNIFILKKNYNSKYNLSKIENINNISVKKIDINKNNFKTSTSENSLTLKQQQEQIEEQIDDANKKQQGLIGNIDKSASEVINLQEQILTKNLEIADLEENEKESYETLVGLKNELEVLKKTEENIKTKAEEILLDLYMKGEAASLKTLLASEDLSEVFSNYYYLREIANMQIEVLEQATTYTNEVENLTVEYEYRTSMLNRTKESITQSKILQENLIKLKNDRIAELSNEELRIVAQIEELEVQRKKIEEEIKNSVRIYGRIEAYVGGIFDWPVPDAPGTRWITSYYGDGYSQGYPGANHTGVDIAPSHSVIGTATANAVQSGRVITAINSNVGYGNYVVIDHGGGVFTLYAHASKLLVSAGDMVDKGTPVIIIGSTGNSTGPHLHFEVRIGGSGFSNIVDPIPYITTAIEPASNKDKMDYIRDRNDDTN